MNEWVKATIVAVGILGVASLGAFVGVIASLELMSVFI